MCSYPPEEIVSRAKQVFQGKKILQCVDMTTQIEGVKEIWLTSEDTGTYGRDIGTSLPQLLWKLVKVIPDGCMMRVGMTNPPYILEYLQVMYHYCTYYTIVSFRIWRPFYHIQEYTLSFMFQYSLVQMQSYQT